MATGGTSLYVSSGVISQSVCQFVRFYCLKITSGHFEIMLVVVQKAAAPKNGVEFCQKSICAIRLISLATLFNDVQEDIW